MKTKYLVNIFFLFSFIFPAAGNKKKIIIMKIKNSGHNRFWATAQLYRNFFFFIAIQFLYCREKEN